MTDDPMVDPAVDPPPIDSAPPLAYSIAQATNIIPVSRTTFYELIKRGELETVHVGARQLIPHKSLVDYLNRLSTEQAATPADTAA